MGPGSPRADTVWSFSSTSAAASRRTSSSATGSLPPSYVIEVTGYQYKPTAHDYNSVLGRRTSKKRIKSRAHAAVRTPSCPCASEVGAIARDLAASPISRTTDSPGSPRRAPKFELAVAGRGGVRPCSYLLESAADRSLARNAASWLLSTSPCVSRALNRVQWCTVLEGLRRPLVTSLIVGFGCLSHVKGHLNVT